MNMTTLAAMLREDLTTIVVRFVNLDTSDFNERLYTYKCTRELAETLERGDIVVVAAKNADNPNGVQTAYVQYVHDEPQLDLENKRGYKWALCKVDVGELENRQAIDERVGKQLEQRRALSCRDQALAALGLTANDAKLLFAPDSK